MCLKVNKVYQKYKKQGKQYKLELHGDCRPSENCCLQSSKTQQDSEREKDRVAHP